MAPGDRMRKIILTLCWPWASDWVLQQMGYAGNRLNVVNFTDAFLHADFRISLTPPEQG